MAIFSKFQRCRLRPARDRPTPGPNSRSQLQNRRISEALSLVLPAQSWASAPEQSAYTLTLRIPAPVSVSLSICIPNNYNAFDGQDGGGPVTCIQHGLKAQIEDRRMSGKNAMME